ncbi:MAG: hypothetical protein RMH77_06775 [Sulfolobales archaeon]|nr:hypothetical protein [Sulfolobales archaeon]
MSKVWLIIAVVLMGVLQFLDTGLYTYITYKVSVEGVYLGLLSATWSLVYIAINQSLSRLADAGRNKLLVFISSLSLILIFMLFRSVNELNGIVIYSLHASAIATLNLALSITILEVYDYFNWNSINTLTRVLTTLIRGLTFLVVALHITDIPVILLSTITLSLTSLILIPRIGLNIERRLFKISKDLSCIGKYVKASSALLYIHKPRDAFEYFERVWSNSNALKPWRVLFSALLYTMFGDIILVILPLYLKGTVGLTDLWLSWGIAFLFASFIVVPFIIRLSSGDNVNTKLIGLTVVARGVVLVSLLPFIFYVNNLIIYLLLVLSLSSIADTLMYNKFVEVSAGYGVSKYFVAREVGSIIGSILGGLLFTFIPGSITVVTIGVAVLSALVIAL